MAPIRISAPAKINLSLEVTGRRPDGFHDLVTFMQEVTLTDEIEIESSDHLRLIADPACGPEDQNLALRAASALAASVHHDGGASITLRKRIPIGAGLGGGSSDAASCLIALNRLWGAGLDCLRLTELAAGLGSDVPFFLTGGSALVTGRGEVVAALPQPAVSWYVLVNPGFHVSTARIYQALDSDTWSSGEVTRELCDRVARGAKIDFGVNSLQPVLFRLYPEAKKCFYAVECLASGPTFVSGSGPTVVVALHDQGEAKRVAEDVARFGYWVCIVRSFSTEDRELPCRA